MAVFLARNGRLRNYFKAVAAKERKNYQSYFEAAMGASCEELHGRWANYVADCFRNPTASEKLPASEVFDDHKNFKAFVIEKQIRLPEMSSSSE